MKNDFYSIGEFSERTGISIRTLHYYDEIGLLTPDKHPTSGYRQYSNQDLLTLQKIVSFKFLGYNLEQIGEIIEESSFNPSFNESLQLQKKAFEEKKEQIESALTAINRTITLIEEEGEVDSIVLMSLINSIQTEKEQRLWLDQHTKPDIVEHLYDKSDEAKLAIDKEFVQLSKEVKRLYGKPAHDLEVQAMVDKYMKASFSFIGEETMRALAESNLPEIDEDTILAELQKMAPSPYTVEEEKWLNEAMEYYMSQHMEDI
ncbi:MerR family transcriptional regulator [Bacillus timonensis]|uniref:MerR family transcriptional regulator n=1 Tax=Bacillus timonensis TaxID=1033734 RepID=UPI000289CF69|nr:MerR family transcriptional regulator [Bacillus timonensis]